LRLSRYSGEALFSCEREALALWELAVYFQFAVHRHGDILVGIYIPKLDHSVSIPRQLPPSAGLFGILLDRLIFMAVDSEPNRTQAIVAGAIDSELIAAQLDLWLF
jgi:hypothetical protein